MKKIYIILISVTAAILLFLLLVRFSAIGCLFFSKNSEREFSVNPGSPELKNKEYYWHIQYDTLRKREYLEKGEYVESCSHKPHELVRRLNQRNTECKIEFVGIIKDTILIRILDDEYLSERMGSAGANTYLGETIFTLTEIESIKYVRIYMDFGSHAGPGIYRREDFNELIINKSCRYRKEPLPSTANVCCNLILLK